MKQFYNFIAVILITALIITSVPSDLFALRPVSHRLEGLLHDSSVSPENYTILSTPTEGFRKFISKNTALFKLDFSLLAISEITDFLQKHDIAIHNLHSIPMEKLSLLVYIMQKLPAGHISGLKIRFVRSVPFKKIHGFYLSPADTVFLSKRLDVSALPSVFLREIGRRVGVRIDEKVKRDLYKVQWRMIPFLGTMILFPLGVIISIHLVALMDTSFSKFQMVLAYLTYAILVKWSFDKLLTGNLIKAFGQRTGLFFNMFNLYIRKNNPKNKITDLSGITPDKYFADAYSAYVLLNQELSKAAEDDNQIKKVYEILKKRILKQRHSHFTEESSETFLENVLLTTAGDEDGKHAFTIALSAYDRENMQIHLKGREQPDVVFLTLNPLINNSALEGLFFQRMFFDSIVKGYAERYKKLLEDLELLAKYTHDYTRKVDEIDVFKDEVIDAGYDVDVLAKGLISGKLTVIVNAEADKTRVLRMVKAFFTGQNAGFYETKLINSGYDKLTAKRLSEEFACNRSFHSTGGLFNRDGRASLENDEAIDEVIDEVIDIQVLTPGKTITLHKGMATPDTPANTIEIERIGDDYLIAEGVQRYYIDSGCLKLRAGGAFYSSWTRREVAMVKKAISLSAQDEDELMIMPLGNADPTPFSGKQDYTNLMLAFNGRGILVDPSAQTLRNMKANDLLGRVDAFYLSHVHWDHFGGMIDFAYQQLSIQAKGLHVSSMSLIAAVAVYETAFDYLNALTGINRQTFEDIFPLVKTKKELDIEAVVFDEELPRFAQMEMLLNRTFCHPLPTYGFKILTEKGSFAYLPDSLMPSKESPLRSKFIEFFGEGVSLLISENGVPGVHIMPKELAEALKKLVDVGVVYTVHSASQQNYPGLQRAQAFELLKIIRREDRYKSIRRATSLLKTSKAVKVADENIPLRDFIRNQFAIIGIIEEMKKGHIIYREGDLVDDNPYLYIILSGFVDIEGIEGAPNNTISLGKGHVLGEMAILRRALNRYSEDDLKILLENGLISQQFIAGIGYYVWKISDISQLKSLQFDDDIKSRLISLFGDSKQLPRSKTVVASEESVLLRIHMDELIKLLDAELKESDSTSSLAHSLHMIMRHRHEQDNKVNGYLAPMRPGTTIDISSDIEKASSAGNDISTSKAGRLEKTFNNDHLFQVRLLTDGLIGDRGQIEAVVERYIKGCNIMVSMCAECGKVYAVRKIKKPSMVSHGLCARHQRELLEPYGLNKPKNANYLTDINMQEAKEVEYDNRVTRFLEMHPEISNLQNTPAKSSSSGWREKFIEVVEQAVRKLTEEGRLPTRLNVARELGYHNAGPLTRRANRLYVDLNLLGVLLNRAVFVQTIKDAVNKLTEESKLPTRLSVARELGHPNASELTRSATRLNVDLKALGVLFNRDVLMQELKQAVERLTEKSRPPFTSLDVARELGYPNISSPLKRRAKRNKINLGFAISS